MAMKLEVNRILSEAFRRRRGFFSKESFDVVGNFFALAGLLLAVFLVLVSAIVVQWIHAEQFAFSSLFSLCTTPFFALYSLVLLLSLTSFGGSIGIGLGRFHFDREEKIRELVNSAESDPLSGLHNRRSFIRTLDAEIQRVQRNRGPSGSAGLLFIDIDHFKRINDTYGHAAGDEVICQLARFLEKECRPYDTVGRWGGEEFVILAPQADLDQAVRFAERLRAGVEGLELKFEYQLIHYTISLGVAAYDGGSETLDEFIQRADDALYRAKEGGRNRVISSHRITKEV